MSDQLEVTEQPENSIVKIVQTLKPSTSRVHLLRRTALKKKSLADETQIVPVLRA